MSIQIKKQIQKQIQFKNSFDYWHAIVFLLDRNTSLSLSSVDYDAYKYTFYWHNDSDYLEFMLTYDGDI